MSALEHARDRWGAAEVVDARSPAPLVELLAEFAALHADAAAGRLDDLLGRALHPSVDGYLGASMLGPHGSLERARRAVVPVGWYVCPECGRKGDREGVRGTARRFCLGGMGGMLPPHPPVEMRVQR